MILRSSFWWVACLGASAIGAASCHWSFCLQNCFFWHRIKISHLQVSGVFHWVFCGLPSLKLTAHPWKLMIGRWSLSFWVWAYFQGRTVSFGEGRSKIWEWSLWDYFPFANDIFWGTRAGFGNCCGVLDRNVAFHDLSINHQRIQVPNLEVLQLLRLFYGVGPLPYMGLIHAARSGFLHFRYLNMLWIDPRRNIDEPRKKNLTLHYTGCF